ncbi:secretin receptor isoform X3 [Arapaima gigas]
MGPGAFSYSTRNLTGVYVPRNWEPGQVFRNCTSQGWTDSFPPHIIACDYAFDMSHFPGKVLQEALCGAKAQRFNRERR